MDSTKLMPIEPVLQSMPLEQPSTIDGASEERKKQIAKDFESLLLNKLLDEMKNTIGDWGFEKDGPSKQIQGIFWLFLAQELANNGGLGLWKDIYQFVSNTDLTTSKSDSLDKNI